MEHIHEERPDDRAGCKIARKRVALIVSGCLLLVFLTYIDIDLGVKHSTQPPSTPSEEGISDLIPDEPPTDAALLSSPGDPAMSDYRAQAPPISMDSLIYVSTVPRKPYENRVLHVAFPRIQHYSTAEPLNPWWLPHVGSLPLATDDPQVLFGFPQADMSPVSLGPPYREDRPQRPAEYASYKRSVKRLKQRSQDEIFNVIYANRDKVQSCYKTMKRKDSALAESVTVRFKIQDTGEVSDISLDWDGKGSRNDELDRLISGVIGNWDFSDISPAETSAGQVKYIFR